MPNKKGQKKMWRGDETTSAKGGYARGNMGKWQALNQGGNSHAWVQQAEMGPS